MSNETGYQARSRGLRIEECLIKEYGWIASTQRQNIVEDIDAFTRKGTSVSIKSISQKTFRSGNLAFELSVEYAGNGWVPSWFRKGKAQKYVFHIEGVGVYLLDKAELVCYIKEHGWDRVAQHRPETRAKQIALGHPHTDAKVGLIKLQTLLNASIAKPLKRGLHCK